MAILKNAKYERFSHLVSQGVHTMPEAYTLAGFSNVYPAQAAARLMKRQDIMERVKELKEFRAPLEQSGPFEATLDGCVSELIQLENEARKRAKFDVALNVVMAVAKLKGFIVDKKVQINVSPIDQLSVEELHKLLFAADAVLATSKTTITVQAELKTLPSEPAELEEDEE
jgi:hypothetical protein